MTIAHGKRISFNEKGEVEILLYTGGQQVEYVDGDCKVRARRGWVTITIDADRLARDSSNTFLFSKSATSRRVCGAVKIKADKQTIEEF
jgi:hypothetical protein